MGVSYREPALGGNRGGTAGPRPVPQGAGLLSWSAWRLEMTQAQRFVPIVVTIEGEPRVMSGSGEQEWKEDVIRAVTEQTAPEKLVPAQRALLKTLREQGQIRVPPLRQDCTVELSFYLSSPRLYQVDLDNLVKPAIDALAVAIFERGSTGRRYDHQDIWVRKIVAEKFVDDRRPRLELTVKPWP